MLSLRELCPRECEMAGLVDSESHCVLVSRFSGHACMGRMFISLLAAGSLAQLSNPCGSSFLPRQHLLWVGVLFGHKWDGFESVAKAVCTIHTNSTWK